MYHNNFFRPYTFDVSKFLASPRTLDNLIIDGGFFERFSGARSGDKH